MKWWRQLRGHWWFMRRYGPLRYWQYEALRREREAELGEGFDPQRHGEMMLRAIGASDQAIAEARRRGLA